MNCFRLSTQCEPFVVFLQQTAYKLLDLSVRLKELGHPNYIDCESLSCGINREEADKKVCVCKCACMCALNMKIN